MELKSIFEIAFSLSSVNRYSKKFLLKQENVLEHTGFVVLFSYLIGIHYNINIGTLLSKAVSHDLDEVVTGDIPRPTKYYDLRSLEVFKQMEEKGVKKLLSNAFCDDANYLKDYVYSNWESSKEGLEGEIVKLADFAAVIYKCWVEYLHGNQQLLLIALNAQKSLEKYELQYLELKGIKESICKFNLSMEVLNEY